MFKQLENLFLVPFVLLGKVFDLTVRPLVSFTFHHLFVAGVGVVAWYLYVRPYWSEILGMLHIR